MVPSGSTVHQWEYIYPLNRHKLRLRSEGEVERL